MTRRFYVRTIPAQSSSVKLVGEEFHHLVHVVRFAVGDTIQLVSSSGMAEGCIQEILHDSALISIQKRIPRNQPSYSIHLLQGLPKIKKMDDIVEKGTEVGIHFFHPLLMKRSYSSLSKEQLKEKTQRWNRIACAATKQCGATRIPHVFDVEPFHEYIQTINNVAGDIVVVAYEAEKEASLFHILPTKLQKEASPANIWLCVGPEGGITEEEIHTLDAKGFQQVTLGDTILRTETAGFFMAGLVRYILEFRC
jgi:16S rRNA (uracil1498-N3)-methyltransferase